MKNIPYILAVSLSLVSLGHAAEEAEQVAAHNTPKVRVHDIKELEAWKTKIEKKIKGHNRFFCTGCTKPKPSVNISGDCFTLQTWKLIIEQEITPGLREWGQSPKNDTMLLGRLDVKMNAKYIEGKGYAKKAVWDEATGDYRLDDIKY